MNGDADDFRELRKVIEAFIEERLREKIAKMPDDDYEGRTTARKKHVPETWLADAAVRVNQLHLATHTLKAIHPRARGCGVYMQERYVNDETLVGTHAVAAAVEMDVTGNSAALDVFKLLKLTHQGESLISRLLRADPCALRALSDDVEQAREWAAAFTAIADAPSVPASHSLAKQVYFPVGQDEYHLLLPLYPTVLVQVWHRKLQADRWSDATQAARKARYGGRPSAAGYVDYRDLAVQTFGGTKPQNVSQLNSERGGKSFLMSNLPPNWNRSVRAPMSQASIFDRAFPDLVAVRDLTVTLRQLSSDSAAERTELLDALVGELLDYAAQLRLLSPGWSRSTRCRLTLAEVVWLDPESVSDVDRRVSAQDLVEWPAPVTAAFGAWLYAALAGKRPDPTQQETQGATIENWFGPQLERLLSELEAVRDEDDRARSESSHAA